MEYKHLGRTGLSVSKLCLGTMNFGPYTNEEDSFRIMDKALELGINFFDTANVYGWKTGEGVTEKIIGRWLAQGGGRREKIVLATKVYGRMGKWPNHSRLSAYHIKKACEESLMRMQTDHIDLYQIHSVTDEADVRSWESSGLYAQMLKWKEEGVIRFIGFTGHTSAAAMKLAAETYAFDTMLIALNHYAPNSAFEDAAIPAAASKGMGVIAMKLIRPRENDPRLSADRLITYGLSLTNVSVALIGTDSADVLAANERILREFKPMNAAELQGMHVALAPFFRNERLPWMQAGYADGVA